LAAPTLIPIKGDISTHSGPLGIVKTYQPRSTEIAALYPARGSHKPQRQYIFEPPTYMDKGTLRAMVWCPQCGEWKRRDAFYRNASRPNGLAGWCRQCHNQDTPARMRAYRARKRGPNIGVMDTSVDKSRKIA